MNYQHLAEPLQKHLIKLVNRESDAEWSKKDEKIPIPKYEKPPRIRLSETVKYAMQQFRV